MNTIEFQIKDKIFKRNLPGNWNELTPKQFMLFCELRSINLESFQFLNCLLFRFLKISYRDFEQLRKFEIESLAETLSFLFESEITLNKFLVNKFSIGLTTFYGPGDGMLWTTVDEMAYIDTYFQKYVQATTQGVVKGVVKEDVKGVVNIDAEKISIDDVVESTPPPQALNKENSEIATQALNVMIACMFRPKTLKSIWRKKVDGGDLRREFNEHHVLESAKAISRLPAPVKHAILLQYIGYRTVTAKANADLYESNEKSDSGFGWAGLIINLAGPEIGNIDQVSKMLWSNAVVFMKKIEWDRKRMKAQMEG